MTRSTVWTTLLTVAALALVGCSLEILHAASSVADGIAVGY